MPNAVADCDYEGQRPSKIIIPGIKERFKSHWYYFSFNAPKEIKIFVTAYLGAIPAS